LLVVAPSRIERCRANIEYYAFFSVPHHANTPESKAQLYDRTELEQN